ncbi:MAG: DUF2177 family protein [Candidatus Hydrogenedentes bacterium]|nr:DUF2177 family protein [Candidatus Hydrogenedentota bacterium]
MRSGALWLAGWVLLTAVDAVVISLILGPFFRARIGPLLNVVDGAVRTNIPAALATWALLSAGLVVFVLPRAGQSLPAALLFGSLFGLLVYGVYDATNMAVLRGWPLSVAVVDVCWGTLLCGGCAAALHALSRLLP